MVLILYILLTKEFLKEQGLRPLVSIAQENVK